MITTYKTQKAIIDKSLIFDRSLDINNKLL